MNLLTPEVQLSLLMMVAWVLLIPIGVLFCVLLFRVITLLDTTHAVIDAARIDLTPLLSSLRETASHVEALTQKAQDGVESLERSAKAVPPLVGKGFRELGVQLVSTGHRVSAIASPWLKTRGRAVVNCLWALTPWG